MGPSVSFFQASSTGGDLLTTGVLPSCPTDSHNHNSSGNNRQQQTVPSVSLGWFGGRREAITLDDEMMSR